MTQMNLEELLAGGDNATSPQLFDNALARAVQPSQLVAVLAQYIGWNSVFGGCVANLAGRIAQQHRLFRDPEAADCIADRSNEVAAPVFYAAIDEFGGMHQSPTHRTLAQATLRESAVWAQIEQPTLLAIQPATQEAMNRVCDGYGHGSDVEGLFHGLGFHAASEILADSEFRCLDAHLRAQHPALVAHLRERRAYAWIAIHTKVEAEHFAAALSGINLALQYYIGDPGQARKWVLEGFQSFAREQHAFLQRL